MTTLENGRSKLKHLFKTSTQKTERLQALKFQITTYETSISQYKDLVVTQRGYLGE